MLELNASLFFISLMVWLLLIVLDRIFFKPVGQVLQERDSKNQAESAQITRMRTEIEAQMGEIEGTLQNARREAQRLKDELIDKGDHIRETLVVEARRQSKERLVETGQQLERELASAEQKLKEEVALFSSKIKELFV